MEGNSERNNANMKPNKRGEKLFWKSWSPDNKKPSKLVFVCHGYAEHCLRYVPMVMKLVEAGCHVFSHDHVGHGRSEGARVHVEDVKHYTQDVEHHVSEVKKEFPELPCFIVGHSLGGAITVLTCLDYPDLFKGAVIIGPALALNREMATPFRIFIAKTLSWIAPQFQIAKMNSDHFTRDLEETAKIKADPLIWHDGAKARMSSKVLESMMEIERRRGEFKLPYLLIHGTDDLICDISGSEIFHKESISTDKTFSPYQGAYHQVHNEPEGQGEKAIKEIVTWIMAR